MIVYPDRKQYDEEAWLRKRKEWFIRQMLKGGCSSEQAEQSYKRLLPALEPYRPAATAADSPSQGSGS